MKCKICKQEAAVALASHNAGFCESCFLTYFRRQIEKGIKGINGEKLLQKNDKILVALSGGKDSLSLMLELCELGYHVEGLYIDLGIERSSRQARETVNDFCLRHGLKYGIINLKDLGLAIPEIKKGIRRPICSMCGKIKRHFFNAAAIKGGYSALATGHNLDDEVARLFSNTLRWDERYLGMQGPLLPAKTGFVKKVKPLWRLSEFETANYAFIKNIEHHSAPCPYSQGASFSVLKRIMGQLEHAMPGRKLDFYQGFLGKGKPHFCQVQDCSPCTCSNCGEKTMDDGTGQPLCLPCKLRFMLKPGKN